MSTHTAVVTRLKEVKKHENADSLDVVSVGAWTCCTRICEFHEGDLAVFIEPDTLVPVAQPEFAFLQADAVNGVVRIKAKRLRGVASFGLLIKARPEWRENQDVWAELGLEHYEPPIRDANTGGEDASAPSVYHVKYDIESLRKYSEVLIDGEEVEITEKIHGANARFVWHDGTLHVGSHTRWKAKYAENLWWRAAAAAKLEDVLQKYPDYLVYGEVYGQVQDLKYGTKTNEVRLAVFDVMYEGRWLPVDAVHELCADCGLDYVPILYRGPWSVECYRFADGRSTLPGADHIREGCVVKPVFPRHSGDLGGRAILKLVSVDYLGRKNRSK